MWGGVGAELREPPKWDARWKKTHLAKGRIDFLTGFLIRQLDCQLRKHIPSLSHPPSPT